MIRRKYAYIFFTHISGIKIQFIKKQAVARYSQTAYGNIIG